MPVPLCMLSLTRHMDWQLSSGRLMWFHLTMLGMECCDGRARQKKEQDFQLGNIKFTVKSSQQTIPHYQRGTQFPAFPCCPVLHLRPSPRAPHPFPDNCHINPLPTHLSCHPAPQSQGHPPFPDGDYLPSPFHKACSRLRALAP